MHTHQGVFASYSRTWPGQTFLMSPEDLEVAFPWPGVRPKEEGEAGPSSVPDEEEDIGVAGLADPGDPAAELASTLGTDLGQQPGLD